MPSRAFATPHLIARVIVALCIALMSTAVLADISRFAGTYVGSAEVISADGTKIPRDMSVEITPIDKKRFTVSWTSTTYRANGSTKSKSYSINFSKTPRGDVYEAAMKRDLFGNDVQLDPMKGEPYVWGRISGDTLTVYSLTVDEMGGYDLQQFDRTLAEGGLMLDFQNIHNGEILRSVSTFLEKQ